MGGDTITEPFTKNGFFFAFTSVQFSGFFEPYDNKYLCQDLYPIFSVHTISILTLAYQPQDIVHNMRKSRGKLGEKNKMPRHARRAQTQIKYRTIRREAA